MSMNTAFTMPDTGFRIEFARFVDFVGPQNLREAISRVASKLARLSPALAQLYRDRYFFHQQCLSVADGPTPFQLDVSDIKAVRAATFIAGVNRIRHSLSAVAIGANFPAVKKSDRRPPIDVASITLPRSPVSLSSGDEVPHIFTRKSRLRTKEFLISSAKRLLQQNLPQAD
jgi:hypothetical protein